MALCQNSTTKYFGRLFLAFVMLLGGVFFTTSESKAAYDYSIPTFNENINIITIPEYTGEAVLVCYNSDGFTIDSSNSTQMAVDLISGYDNETFIRSKNLAYFENPPKGSKAWAGTNKCILVKNYDSNKGITLDRLYVKYPSCETNFSFSTSTPEIGNDFTIGIFTSNNDYRLYGELGINNGNVLISEKEFHWSGSNYANNLFISTTTELINNLYSFSVNGAGCITEATIYRLNIGQQTAPPSNNYVMYYGANPVYTPVNSNYNLPVVYNVCDSWEDGKILLKLNNDNASSSEKLLTQCSGTFNFNSGAGSSEMSNTSYFTIENFSSDTILATSEEFLSTVYKPLNASDGFIVWNFPVYQYFDYTKTATTTDLDFQYNVCSDANYATSSQICIRNTSNPTNNPTSYCVNLATCSGTSTITLPIFAAERSLTLNFSYYDKDNNYQLESNQFSVVYYNGTYDTRAKWLVQAGEIACSPEEWASTDWWVNIKCGVFTGGVAIAQTLGDSAAAGVKILVGMLDGIFPFNLPIKIKECWDNSETELLPTELNKINILDETGNVKINMPSEWADSGSITIWGSDIWNSTNETNEYFTFIRYLSKYLIWGIFILIFYLWGKSLIEK